MPHDADTIDGSLDTDSGDRASPASRHRLGLTIAHHPDLDRVGEVAHLPALHLGRQAPVSRREPVFCPPGRATGRALDDPRLSRRPFFIARSPDGVRLLPGDTARNRVRAAGQPLAGELRFPWEALRRGVTLRVSKHTLLLLHLLAEVGGDNDRLGLLGDSAAAWELRREILRVAPLADVPVLLRGPSGSGKELVARAIHARSALRAATFVAINIASIPPSLAASTLFGHKRGAFSGADRDAPGCFVTADGGTLLLDEIGDASDTLQLALLRAAETGEITPVGASGGRDTRRVRVRLVSATDADLASRVADGRFRTALLQRLAGYTIQVPPLRDRLDDIPRLFVHFARSALFTTRRALPAGTDGRPWLPASLTEQLLAYGWPGNVRELHNAARQLAIRHGDEPHVPSALRLESLLPLPSTVDPPPRPQEKPPEEPPAAARTRPAELTDDELLDALRANGWRFGPTAKSLGIARSSLLLLIDASPRVRRPKELSAQEIRAALAAHGGRVDAAAMALEVSIRGLKLRISELKLSS